jgi:hypothetical protein
MGEVRRAVGFGRDSCDPVIVALKLTIHVAVPSVWSSREATRSGQGQGSARKSLQFATCDPTKLLKREAGHPAGGLWRLLIRLRALSIQRRL